MSNVSNQLMSVDLHNDKLEYSEEFPKTTAIITIISTIAVIFIAYVNYFSVYSQETTNKIMFGGVIFSVIIYLLNSPSFKNSSIRIFKRIENML